MSADQTTYFPRAPVVERVVGTQFQPDSRIHSALLGAFWKLNFADWHRVSEAPPINQQFETFPSRHGPGGAELAMRLMPVVSPRLQVLNDDMDWMIQLQNGRFHVNWRGGADDDYPRYQELRRRFEEYWSVFVQFLSRETGLEVQPNQWEITYVNQIPKGTVWHTTSDWPAVFRQADLNIPVDFPGHQFESVSATWDYEITPKKGRLHAELSHGVMANDPSKEVLTLSFTARGPATNNDDVLSGLDSGHSSINSAFGMLTSDKAQKYWSQDGNR